MGRGNQQKSLKIEKVLIMDAGEIVWCTTECEDSYINLITENKSNGIYR